MKSLRRKESNYVWILDAGHGGIKNGVYTTAPAKQHTFPDGWTIQEGVINRAVLNFLIQYLIQHNIDFEVVSDDEDDTSLDTRIVRADNIYHKNRNAIFVSIHSNAGGGSGNEIFTSPGQTKSDKVANIFCEVYQKHFPHYPFRKDTVDGDADKEANFKVLRKTDAPAVLVENFFFDNWKEAKYLSSEQGQMDIAYCLCQCILNVEKLQPI
jgi:N-acetylmuramoyl-L-alanine amidase